MIFRFEYFILVNSLRLRTDDSSIIYQFPVVIASSHIDIYCNILKIQTVSIFADVIIWATCAKERTTISDYPVGIRNRRPYFDHHHHPRTIPATQLFQFDPITCPRSPPLNTFPNKSAARTLAKVNRQPRERPKCCRRQMAVSRNIFRQVPFDPNPHLLPNNQMPHPPLPPLHHRSSIHPRHRQHTWQ